MLDKAYDPKATEDAIYASWEKSGAFKPESCPKDGEPFTISMPPPNATGQLHLGHAVMLALEDIFIRFARMNGKRALWVPGTDHASIATESVVIRKIQKEEKVTDPRKTLGREGLLKRIHEFVEDSRGTIRGQVRKMGSSCDWERERYTMDPTLARTTYEIFTDMYNKGVIYRGHRMVNWDPKLQTTLADDEVVYEEKTEPFYTFRYGPFEISTSRPETKFGDKYVVMHPDDKRYKKYKHGDTFDAEWINGSVRATVIKDTSVDPEFGTGVMTITPSHDHIDFEIAERHGLEKEQVIDFSGALLKVAGEFAGMKIDVARPLIVEKLEKKGLLVSVKKDYQHNVAISSRGGGIVEPQIKEQWFVDVNREAVPWKGSKQSLKAVMQDTVRSGMIKIIPAQFEKIYFNWIDNLRDWCVSRQIWWGHRIPAWYRNGETYVGVQPPEGDGWEQDSDTLDTWFGVAQWTWSTLIDPKAAADPSLSLRQIFEKSPHLKTFHPTTVMETGYDILFFWVARMILMTTYSLSVLAWGKDESERIPFKTVYLHGLIRTRDGKKMSKSHPETMIDPLDMISKYGADALRLSMIVGQAPGADSRLYEEKIAGYRNFINKLWNASRFVLMQCEQVGIDPKTIDKLPENASLSLADRAVLHASECLIEDITKGLRSYNLSGAGDKLYSFVWDYFCDWYLELSKGTANHAVLVHVLRRILKLLHPYCPFVTEQLWGQVKKTADRALISETWPAVHEKRKDPKAFMDLQVLIDVISSIRKLRNDHNVEPGKEITVTIVGKKFCELLESQEAHIRRMCKVGSLTFTTDSVKVENAASAFLSDIEIHLSLAGLFDAGKLKESLLREQAELTKYVSGLQGKLSNKSFVDKAPKELVDEQKTKLAETEEKLKKIEERLKQID
ncbi:valine--tRNA ligase [Candidatus Peribacteria bacterium]|nr:valine--tRNA ligase [Candidatus Peribacteria bacterium]